MCRLKIDLSIFDLKPYQDYNYGFLSNNKNFKIDIETFNCNNFY